MTTTVASPPAPFPPPAVRAAVGRAMVAANDRPDPSLDDGRTPQKYAALAQDFRSRAWRHLDEGDLPQASNKAWGLVAETIKDIAAQHGAIIHTHRTIVAVLVELARLARNAGDTETHREVNRGLMTAGKLHINFYENELHEDTVIDGLIQCEEISERLYRRFAAAPPPPGARRVITSSSPYPDPHTIPPREAPPMTTTVASPPAPFPPPAVRAAVGRAMVAANDRPHPTEDSDRTPQKYAALAQDFRNSAWQHLDAGDLPQASNKAWGLVAETIKDISAQHGAIIHYHRTIAEVVTQLTSLVFNSGDTATASWIGAIFLTASKLHSNFYENELGENIVLAGLMQCEELSALLYRMFGAPAPAV